MRVSKIRVIRQGVIVNTHEREDLQVAMLRRLAVGKDPRYRASQVVGFISCRFTLAQVGRVFYFDTALTIQTVSTPKIRNTAFC